MKRSYLRLGLHSRTLLLLLLTGWTFALQVNAQFSAKAEKSIDEYFEILVKVYQVIESNEIDAALGKLDGLKPSIEKKAMVLAEIAKTDPEILLKLDEDDSFELFQDKPYYKEIMRIAQSENFSKKIMASVELQLKLEELENIIESYTQDINSKFGNEQSAMATGVAFSITLSGEGKFTGTHQIVADFEEESIAYIDDLDYLRIDINGEVDGKEAFVAFFVENKGSGKQEWETEGQFVFEMMDSDGDLFMSLWGSEEMGYFDITSVDGPGGFVTGEIHGNCMDGDSDTERIIPITATFKAGFIENLY